MKLNCVVLQSFKRVKKRTKADLQAELDRLSRQLDTATAVDLDSAPSSSLIPLSPDTNVSSRVHQVSLSNAGPEQTPSQSPSNPMTNMHGRPLAPATTSPTISHTGVASALTPTSSQTLEDLEFCGAQIDDCFSLFLTHYAPKVHVFDTVLDPNACHPQSPLLFWTIVTIGARKYSQDPTILMLLAPKVIELAQRSIFHRENPLSTLQAFLLLTIWPMPVDTMHKDISPVLAGAMLNLAVAIGLHVHGVGQDFSRTTLRHEENERIFRAKLWLSCLIASQSCTISNGLPPPIVLDTYDYVSKGRDALSGVPIELRFRRKLSQTVSIAILELGRAVLSVDEPGGASSLKSIIGVFMWQLSQLDSECSDQPNHFFLSCARLQIQSFHFFIRSPEIDSTSLVQLYIVACTVIEAIVKMDGTEDVAGSSTAYIQKMLLLAAFVILRITRSHLAPTLDLERGRKAYFALIFYCRRVSLQDSDLSSRAGVILTQLWTSKNAFENSDGTVDCLTLRCRSRLSMSVVFDCFWRWRREFAGQATPYEEPRNDKGATVADAPANNQISPAAFPAADLEYSQYMLSSWSPQGTFPDYGWAATLDLPIETWNAFQLESEVGEGRTAFGATQDFPATQLSSVVS
ncbi:uncharacterized protein Z518_01168 [Rhinocladiella mackenziei CBS 650.93]|uniref:Transcription factor domain-containing protein n=1 Tax=Rhinocladiella mackenziei CBS 650.93 TaxID=1442369 RepID=A0A0D2G5H9_9EURO|nr:uncharacterized protein Z518_01168 [Rhinocladiella mackenziei CBS 650.93]KIX10087.1 hypothetical protein Z518_01168 [Rhinocladiella mackenziei CBS 650.93]